jgi:hypothetical protein
MGYRPQARTARDFVRRSEKAKQKKSDKERASSSQVFSEERVLTSREVFDRTLNTLNHLGNQRFPIAPFYEHFDRWLLNLRTVLSEFESNPLISVDEQFAKQYSQVLSDIEQALKERREKEVSHEEEIRRINRNLQDARNLLARTEHEHAVKEKEIADRKKRAIKPPVGKAKKPRKEQNRIVPSGTSFLRGLFRKAQPQKETETTQIPASAKREVSRIEQSFADEQKKLQDEYDRREQSILEKVANHQKEIEDLEAKTSIDDAVNLRREACEALVDAVNALLLRTKTTSEATSPSP